MLKNLDKSITALRLGREGHLHLRDELRRVSVGHSDLSAAGEGLEPRPPDALNPYGHLSLKVHNIQSFSTLGFQHYC